MPSIEENRAHWSAHGWENQGEQWSEVWGDTDTLWFGSLRPRIRSFLQPAQTILEIAPGYGRITQFLTYHCSRLVVVDLAERCIAACKERFADLGHIEYHTNDGRSLPMVADQSIDLVFSFDSLVHAERDAIEGYITEFSRVLRPDGVGFIHHSNVGQFREPKTGKVEIANKHWRGHDVSASLFRDLCVVEGLSCFLQEKVTWGATADLTDCFSVFAHPGSRWDRPYKVVENGEFMQEAVRLGKLVALYSAR